MKLRLSFLLGALLLVLGTIGTACGGDDEEPTLEEFFQQAQAIDDDFEQRFEQLYDDHPDLYENFQEYEAYYGEFVVVFADFLDELRTLNPPSEVDGAFDELVTAGSEFGGALQELIDRLEGVESFAEAEQFLGEGEFQADDGPYWDACQSLDKIALANGIVVSFDCGIGSRTSVEPRPPSERTP